MNMAIETLPHILFDRTFFKATLTHFAFPADGVDWNALILTILRHACLELISLTPWSSACGLQPPIRVLLSEFPRIHYPSVSKVLAFHP